MTVDPPETTYAVLGLIAKLPGSSGHELAAVADRSFAHFWPISRTLLYRELNRLGDRGWTEAIREEQTRVPSKWTYTITGEGERVLAEWLRLPVPMTDTFRSGALLRFFFAHQMEVHQVQALLQDYRSALQSQRDGFAALVDKLAGMNSPGARTGRLGALHGLRTAEARLGWVEEVSHELLEADAD